VTTRPRALVIGLDGATWSVLDPWILDGTLPHLGRLRDRGSWGPLRSTFPPITPAAWGTFMTGKRPGKHGVFHFVPLFEPSAQSTSEAGPPAIVSATNLRSATLWDQLAHHGRRVALVNIPLTYPPRAVNGIMVTGMLTPPGAEVFTYPPELGARLNGYMIDLSRYADKVPFVDAIEGDDAAPSLSLIAEYREMLEQRAQTLERLMVDEPWDFFMAVFMDTDRLGHYLWGFHGGDDASHDPALVGAIRAHYVRLDEVLGRLVDVAGPDVATFVASDHGMGPRNSRRLHVNVWLHEQGWLTTGSAVAGATSTRAESLMARLPIPRDRVGRIALALPGVRRSRLVRSASKGSGRPVDEARSKAYGVTLFNHVFGIRLTDAEPERSRVRDAIIAGLQDLRDAETGRAVIERITIGSDYYQGPFAAGTPDLIVEADPDYAASFRVQSYSAPVTRLQAVSARGHHRMDGVLIAAGPSIRSAASPIDGACIEDLAPTILQLMGVPIPDDVDGRPLSGLFEPAARAAGPATYEPPRGRWGGDRAAAHVAHDISAEEAAELTSRLEALGYLD
jgi:predicted AlkP superfamily phosphohydrolase/phosphomutase